MKNNKPLDSVILTDPNKLRSIIDKAKNCFNIGDRIIVKNLDDLNSWVEKLKKLQDPNLSLYSKIFIGSCTAPIPLEYSNCVELRNSNIHGKGLFATSDIPEHVIITYYPAHMINHNDNLHYQPNYALNQQTVESIIMHYSHYIDMNNDLAIVGDPNLTDNKFLLGHMINDAGGNVFNNIPFNDTKNYITFKNLITQYYINAAKSFNCDFTSNADKNIICAVTTRKILKNEEILVMYEPLYWFNVNYNMANNTPNNHATEYYLKLMTQDSNFMLFMATLLHKSYGHFQ